MKTWMEAHVSWVSYDKGGREKHMPANAKYCPIIVFPGEKMNGTWSAEILVKSVIDNNESTIDISFLFDDAPFELLKPGADFELYEGSKLVAKGVMVKKIDVKF